MQLKAKVIYQPQLLAHLVTLTRSKFFVIQRWYYVFYWTGFTLVLKTLGWILAIHRDSLCGLKGARFLSCTMSLDEQSWSVHDVSVFERIHTTFYEQEAQRKFWNLIQQSFFKSFCMFQHPHPQYMTCFQTKTPFWFLIYVFFFLI